MVRTTGARLGGERRSAGAALVRLIERASDSLSRASTVMDDRGVRTRQIG